MTAPMAGAPSETVLAEARLVASSCEADNDVTARRAEALIREMDAAINEQYRDWRDTQRSCWEQYRHESRRYYSPKMADSWGYGGGLGLSGVGAGGGGRGYGVGLGSGSAKAKAARSASGTNNQVAGVDEADIVKNDGRYVYVAMNGALRILEALDPRTLSVTKFDGTVREMFVNGDRAVLYVSKGGNGSPRCTYGYDCQFAGDGSTTSIVVLDVSNRSKPLETRRIELSGSLMAARRIGDAIHTVVADNDAAPPSYSVWPDDLPMCGVKESFVRSRLKKLRAENTALIRAQVRSNLPTMSEHGQKKPLCEQLLHTPISDGEAFTSVISIDMKKDAHAPKSATLQSRPGAVFASGDALYLSVVHGRAASRGRWYSFYPTVDEVSDIHKFS
ncbi:MAG TPA: beta-propeller domain-containing protein, partial [Polyangiaceae bacterium]|nr:beta-propeller domain-containing protein [Polyangiaceae bacterium]